MFLAAIHPFEAEHYGGGGESSSLRKFIVSRGQPLPLDEGRVRVWSTDVDLFVLEIT